MRIDVGGRSLFMQCVGTPAGPTLILEAGLAADSRNWAAVQAAAAELTRVCRYDRAGLGQSDPAATPRTAVDVSADLAALLGAAGITGPYVLVAHSFGGLFARQFTADHPEDVVGLVFVDAVHEDWWARALTTLPPERTDDNQRLRSFRRFLTIELADPGRNAEGIDIPATAEQAHNAGNLGHRPIIVLSSGIFDVLAPGLPAEVETALRKLFQQTLPQELAALSRNSTVVRVPDSGHNLPQQRPDAVVLAIRAVLAAAG